MRTKRLFFCTILLAFLFAGQAEVFGQQTMYDVSTAGGFRTLLTGGTLNDGDTIRLLGGVYTPSATADSTVSFVITKAITISGGWNAGFTARNPLNPSVLSGDYSGLNPSNDVYNHTVPSLTGLDDNADQVLIWNVPSTAQGKIDGVVITGGGGATTNNNATGLTLVSGKLDIVNTTFTLNKRALHASGSSTVLRADSCTFTENYNGTYGTALTLLDGVNATVTNSVFDKNAAAYSPVHLNTEAKLIVSHSTFNDNLITTQGGAVIGVNGVNSVAQIVFSTFTNNKRTGLGNAGDISAVLAYKGSAEVYHCTFIGNVVQGEVLHARNGAITYGGNVFLGNTTNAAGTQLAYVTDNAATIGAYLTDAGYNVFNAGGGSFIGIGIDDEEVASEDEDDYFAGGTYTGSLYKPLLDELSGYTPVVMPDGAEAEDLIIVPKAVTEGWLSAVWQSSLPAILTDQRNVKLVAINNNYYAGSVHLSKDTGVTLDIIVFLEGVMKPDGTMTNYMQTADSNYSLYDSPCFPATNPYGISGNTYPVTTASGPAGALVDWVRVDIIRILPGYKANILESRALLLKTTGEIVDTDGQSPQFNPQDGEIHILVSHRNHLAVMSPGLTLTNGMVYNFSTNVNKAMKDDPADPDPMVSAYSVWCMYAGDVDGSVDGSVARNHLIDDVDYRAVFKAYNEDSGDYEGLYTRVDLSINGYISNDDYTFVSKNFTLAPISPIANYTIIPIP